MRGWVALTWCLVCASVSVGVGEDYHPDRTLLIDHHPASKPINFLFRGNMPIVNGTFAYDQVISKMKAVLTAENLTFPTDYTLLDVSYLNIFEEKDLQVEKDFFDAKPSLGRLYKKLIVGSEIPPPENDTNLIKDVVQMYVDGSVDQLPKLMEFFRSLLTGPGPALIYSHCEAGTDRTGEVSGAYYLKFLSLSFSEALKIDNAIQNRDMYKVSRNALQWYCFYLKYIENKTQLQCIV